MAAETIGLNSIDKIQEVASSTTDGKNNWSSAFPKTLIYLDGVSLEDVESLNHDRLLSFAQKLQELRTYEVTSAIFDSFRQHKEEL